MIQLEFESLVSSLTPCAVRAPRVKARPGVLEFMRAMFFRKYRKKLPDIDVMVLLALAFKSPRALRFTEVLDCLPGASQTGVWKALERLDDYGLVRTCGRPAKHTYEITADGVMELHYLTQ